MAGDLGDYRTALEAAGLVPGEIVPDGRIHRCGTTERPRSKDGWFVLYLDPPAGAFGNWRTGTRETWNGNGRDMDPETRRRMAEQIQEAKRAREEEERQRQAQAAERARKILESLPEADDSNPYLRKKGVRAVSGLKVDGNVLVVPMYGPHGVMSLQRIEADGTKRFMRGSKTAGGFFPIRGLKDGPLYIVEGIATGLSVHEENAGTVLVAFMAGNLEPVARLARERYPNREIVVCADDDRETARRTGTNPGIEKATQAAKAVGATLATPGRAGDFNDVHQAGGLLAVKKRLEAAQSVEDHISPDRPLTIEQTSVRRFLDHEPPEQEYIFEGLLPRPVVAALIGLGGSSKGFILLVLALSAAIGEAIFKGFDPAKAFRVLALFAEDPTEILHARIYRIVERLLPDLTAETKALISENLHAASVLGRVGPLMQLQDGNPIKSPWWFWLRDTIEAMGGVDLLILDPKSRLYGLEENDNTHNTMWVACLEELAQDFGATILFSHHANKHSGGALDQGSARGGSALVDGCRWVANVRQIDEKTAKRYDLENPRDFVEFDISKTNYAAPLRRTFYFKRSDHGVLVPANLDFSRLRDKARALCELLTEAQKDDKTLTRRELRERPGKEIRAEIGCSARETMEAVDFALREGWLKATQLSGPWGPSKTVLEPTTGGGE